MAKSSQQRSFPGWRWVAVAAAFPVAGLIGGAISGPVDAFAAALVGGALTGAGLGAVQWWAAEGSLGPPAAWIGSSAAGYAGGLAAGAALVGYNTDVGSLAAMGLVSGGVLGAAQAGALVREGDTRLAAAWGAATPVLFALGWCASTAIGVNVDEQFTVFGAAGAILAMVLSGLVLARFAGERTRLA
jgi:hypothetical protein